MRRITQYAEETFTLNGMEFSLDVNRDEIRMTVAAPKGKTLTLTGIRPCINSQDHELVWGVE